MPKEYRTIQEIAGPLMLVQGVEGVTYNELGEIELASGEKRRCKVLEIDGTNAMVQLFESSTGINPQESKVRFLGRTMELGVSEDMLDAFYGKGNWKRMPNETYKRLRHEPESWTVEVHTVEVYVGTDGYHQDEFVRGDRPKDIFPNSIVTPSLQAAILNGKYVNAIPLYRLELKELF